MLLHDTVSDVDSVRSAIAILSPAERDLLVLRFRDDLPTAALAAATGMSAAAVERRLHRAAWVVEDVAGAAPPRPAVDWSAPPDPAPRAVRSTELVVEEAALGITPLLAARLAAAVAGPVPPAADEHWRWHTLLAALRHHGEGVVTALVAGVVVLPTIASLTVG